MQLIDQVYEVVMQEIVLRVIAMVSSYPLGKTLTPQGYDCIGFQFLFTTKRARLFVELTVSPCTPFPRVA